MRKGVCKQSHASYDEAWISYIDIFFLDQKHEAHVILNKR